MPITQIYIYIHALSYMYLCTRVHIYVCIHVGMYVGLCVCMDVCMHVPLCGHDMIYICIQVHVHPTNVTHAFEFATNKWFRSSTVIHHMFPPL